MKTKTIFGIVSICVICAATMMSGCVENRTPHGYLIESDGYVNTYDQKLNKFQQQAIDGTYRCNLQNGKYTVDIPYTSQLDELLEEFYVNPTDYTNMRISDFTRVEIDDGKVTSCKLVITGNHIEDKALTVMAIHYRKPEAVGTIDSGLKHAEVEPPHLIFGKYIYTLQPETKSDKSIHDECQKYDDTNIPDNRIYNRYNLVSENMIFMDDIIEIITEHNIPYKSKEQVFDARDFVNLYPTLTIHQIDSIDNSYNCHVFGWLAVLDDNVVGGDLQIQSNRGDPPGGDYKNFRGFITVDYTSRDEIRKAAIFSLI